MLKGQHVRCPPSKSFKNVLDLIHYCPHGVILSERDNGFSFIRLSDGLEGPINPACESRKGKLIPCSRINTPPANKSLWGPHT